MGIVKVDGYSFVSSVSDHRPYHVHINYGGKELGRWDIENQRSMDRKLKMTNKLKEALKKAGYLE